MTVIQLKMGVVNTLTAIWNALVNANPIGLIIIAVMSLIMLFNRLMFGAMDFETAMHGLALFIDMIMQVLGGAVTFLWEIIKTILIAPAPKPK